MNKILTQMQIYNHGVYLRDGDRLVVSREDFIPSGFAIIGDSKLILKDYFTDGTGDKKDGYSYIVMGWKEYML